MADRAAARAAAATDAHAEPAAARSAGGRSPRPRRPAAADRDGERTGCGGDARGGGSGHATPAVGATGATTPADPLAPPASGRQRSPSRPRGGGGGGGGGGGSSPRRSASPFRRPHRRRRPPSTPRRRRVGSGGSGGGSSGGSGGGHSGGRGGGRAASAPPAGHGRDGGGGRAVTDPVAGATAGVARRLPDCLRATQGGGGVGAEGQIGRKGDGESARRWRSERRRGGGGGDDGDGGVGGGENDDDRDGDGGGGGGGDGGGGGSGDGGGGGWGADKGCADGSGSDSDVRVGEWEDPPDGWGTGGAPPPPPSPAFPAASGHRHSRASGGTAAAGNGGAGGGDGGDVDGGRRVGDPSQASSRRPSTLRFWEVVAGGRRRRRTATRVELLDAVHDAVRTGLCGHCGGSGGGGGGGGSTDSGCEGDGGGLPPPRPGGGVTATAWAGWAGVARRRARRPGGRTRAVPPPADGRHPPHNLLQLRDLRQVDPAFVAKPALWVRRNALILSLGGVRALILHDRLFLFDPDAPAVGGAYRVVAARLAGLVTGAATTAGGGGDGGDDGGYGGDGGGGGGGGVAGTPFEFLALEGLLIAAVVSLERSFGAVEPGLVDTLAALAEDLSVGRLEELRAAEQRLVTFQGGARSARRVLVDALGDDPALAAMYLTDGARHPGRRRNPLDHGEAEALLEAYLQLVDDLATRASLLLRAIDDTETLIVIHLDILQNHLLLVALLISMASTVLAAGSTVTALFGMNLALPPAMATLPSSATYFWGVLAGLVGGMAAAFAGLLGCGHAAGLLPRTPHRHRREAPLAHLAAKARAWPRARRAELARRAAAAAGDALDGAGDALDGAGDALDGAGAGLNGLNGAGDALGAAGDALGAAGDALGALRKWAANQSLDGCARTRAYLPIASASAVTVQRTSDVDGLTHTR
ncbi:hypothetical protein I4F81_002018 [Pyropia yezoensis]|uniref:Uncharacterized protein n=1 Tax=Pyropia yezoensis TaxID=2788 RepID=A0ACC3BPJ8_PYRYE|nr:hypothetical protein I4F81_002018 [Neopyropia yezoensis]